MLAVLLVWPSTSSPLYGQTFEDGVMMDPGQLCTGFVFAHDSWNQYWEGDLKRGNGNIGSLTTRSVSWVAAYGATESMNIIASVPYVWTRASEGVLHGMNGFQDATLGIKYNLLVTPFTSRGTLRAFVVGAAGTPISDYTPDFYPLSIGSSSRRFSGRFTLNFQSPQQWFLTGSTAYTWRRNVTLDRTAYYTEGRLYLTDEVGMPNVFDYTLSAGYRSDRLYVPISFYQQRTLGGSDIRRQDMPFVSNRMNASRIEGAALYYLPTPRNLGVRLSVAHTLSGRNVGQSTTVSFGLLYIFHFAGA